MHSFNYRIKSIQYMYVKPFLLLYKIFMNQTLKIYDIEKK